MEKNKSDIAKEVVLPISDESNHLGDDLTLTQRNKLRSHSGGIVY